MGRLETESVEHVTLARLRQQVCLAETDEVIPATGEKLIETSESIFGVARISNDRAQIQTLSVPGAGNSLVVCYAEFWHQAAWRKGREEKSQQSIAGAAQRTFGRCPVLCIIGSYRLFHTSALRYPRSRPIIVLRSRCCVKGARFRIKLSQLRLAGVVQ